MTGGGSSADDEALVLAQYADLVLLFHRRDELRAQKEVGGPGPGRSQDGIP